MNNKNARDKIFKIWAGISEEACIKEVATKGEHIQLCIEYWASKRKCAEEEYSLHFHDVVAAYVQRLLSERLVLKAETVIRNVQRNVKCFYYQFACECGDEELRELVLDYLRRKETPDCKENFQELEFYWSLLQQLKECDGLLKKYKAQLPRLNLEALIKLDNRWQQRLFVELYFYNGNEDVLELFNKCVVWECLVDSQQHSRIYDWCRLNAAAENGDTIDLTNCNSLELKFSKWSLEPNMYEYALNHIQTPNELLRDCFARVGYFFADEITDISKVLRRLCTTESLEQNIALLEKLPIGKHLLERSNFQFMLQSFVSSRELEELSGGDDKLLEFIVALKTHDLKERAGFEQLATAGKTFLESYSNVDFENQQPLVTFHEFLCHEPSIQALNCFLHSSALKLIPYLKSLTQRFEHGNDASTPTTIPTPYDLLRKFKRIDIDELRKNTGGDVASFSNERLCQKYARKYQLNYLHYLKQQRSAYAVYYLITDQLQNYSQITRTQLLSACETITEFALQHYRNKDLVAHCIACCEMLGFDTQFLRSFLLLSTQISARVYVGNLTVLIKQIDANLVQRLKQQPTVFPLESYQALMRLVVRYQQLRQWPALILKHYAAENDWWILLLLLQYFELPLTEVKELLAHFGTRTLGEHLLRALSYEPPITNERIHKRSLTRQHSHMRKADKYSLTSSQETVTSTTLSSCQDANLLTQRSNSCNMKMRFLPDTNDNLDIFALILLSSSNQADEQITTVEKYFEVMQNSHTTHATSCNLLKQCIKYHLPILAVLAATVSSLNLDWCWVTWLAIATDNWTQLLSLTIKSEQELVWTLIEHAVRQGYTATLYNSFRIFFQTNPLLHLCNFLQLTQHSNDFSDNAVTELSRFLLYWSNDEFKLPLSNATVQRVPFMQRCIRLLLIHLQQNFESTVEQQKLLDCICHSDMSDICGLLDFCLLRSVFKVTGSWLSRFPINFELLLQRDSKEYTRLLAALVEAKAYDAAIRLATLLQLPICDIVYTKWSADVDAGQLYDHQQYESEIIEHALPPEMLVNFFLYAAAREVQPCARKYNLLKHALNVIKQHHLFPNESFDRDQIEYDMTLCYLQIPETNGNVDVAATLEVYHSEYFEQIMLKERCVLYKSFVELKELAGIEDLSIATKVTLTESMQIRLEALLNKLLDDGDIVEALRLQELFEFRPTDLRFIVFCMALAEDVTTIFNMSAKERQLLSDIEKSAFAKFNRRTLAHSIGSASYQGQSDSCSTLEFEEIPSKEKQQTLDTIQGIASKLKYGIDIGKRIVLAFRAAMYLDKEYLDVLRTKDISVLLKSVAQEECMHRLMVVSDILSSTHTNAKEIAELLSFEIATCVVRPRFYIFTANQQTRNHFKNAELWGYNIDRDLHLFLELTPNTTMLGNCLLEYCDALRSYRKYQDNKDFISNDAFKRLVEIIARYGLPTPSPAAAASVTVPTTTATSSGNANGAPPPQVLSHKKQNLIYVELLIKAHQCFVHECSMEGIANVLHRAKALNTLLTNAKSWSLIVRMLIGIARYREMFYCFDALIENEQFESLLGKFDEEQTCSLRQAILCYLKEYHHEHSKELLKLAALHFRMYKELAEMWEEDGKAVLIKVRSLAQVHSTQLLEQPSMVSLITTAGTAAAAATTAAVKTTLIPKLKSTTDIIKLLEQALENFIHATENYLLDNKLILAQRSAAMAELIAMQIDLATKALNKHNNNNTTNSNSMMQCVCVINVQTRDDFRELINSELSVAQSLILSRAYGFDINWSEVLLAQYVILQRSTFLTQYLMRLPITDGIIENIIKSYLLYAQQNQPNPDMELLLAELVDLIKSVTLKYKLASVLGLKATVMSLINEHTMHYLRDTNYGRSESKNIPDI